MCYLKYRVPFFRAQSRELVATLIEKLECKLFEKGESRKYLRASVLTFFALRAVMDQGDIGDSMFVIYSGECGVYVFRNTGKGQGDTSHSAVAILGPNTVVGETAVTDRLNSGRRTATVLAHSAVVTLKITKADY